MKTHDALAVANWFLERAEKDGESLSPMKLQKLIYFAHGWSLALADVPLIREHPEAWDWGPVIPSVYHEFKSFGRGPIEGRGLAYPWPESNKIEEILGAVPYEPAVDDDDDAEGLLARIWEVYGNWTAAQLSNTTHARGGAWHRAYHEVAKGRRGVDISDELIKDEFIEKQRRGARRQPSPA